MKAFYSFIYLVCMLPLAAQVADKSVSDCAGNTRSIHGVLGSGKVLVVASKGLDCSICKGAAPAVQSFAAQNVGSIEVWGAMTFTYNSNTPTCSQVGNWVSTYGWTDIFTFVDSDCYWFMTGTPRYIVYDPSDFSEAYKGPNRSVAFQTAMDLANTVGIRTPKLNETEIINMRGGLEVRNLATVVDYQLIGLTGALVGSGTLDAGNNRISTLSLRPGIYLLTLKSQDGNSITRKVLVN